MIFLNQFELNFSQEDIRLAESGQTVQKWVQLFRLGHWKHPRFGPLKFTEEIFNGFVSNFNDNVRRIELAIDQEHKPEKGAAGWFKKVENRGEEGFWALVEWTKEGVNLLKDKTFKYLSGDYDYTWKDEETGKVFKNVLFGAALTNRPFIKGMSPINLSEFIDEIKTVELVRDSLRLAEDVLKLKEDNKVVRTDEEILKAKDEDLTEEEKVRKTELQKKLEEGKTEEEKKKEEEEKKKLKDKEIERNPDPSTDKTDAKKDAKKEAAVKLAEDVKKKKEDDDKKKEDKSIALKKRAVKVGLAEDSSEEDIIKEEKKKEKIDEKGIKTLADMTDEEILKTPDDQLDAAGKARKKELLSKKPVNLSDISEMEIHLSELQSVSGEDDMMVKLLSEHIKTQKLLTETNLQAKKDKIEAMLDKAWMSGKIVSVEKDLWRAVLCSEVENGERSITLSEVDEDGEEQEVSKTLAEIFESSLEIRPCLVENVEIALQEKNKIEGNPDPHEEAEKDEALGKEIANRTTNGTKAKTKAKKDVDINPDKNE